MNERFYIKGIEVWATLKKKNYPKKWYGESRTSIVNVFTIHLRKDATEVTFPFYDSIVNCTRGVTKMKRDDLRNAVDCILCDATCADKTFEDFCDETGYEFTDNGAKKLYDACRKALEKVLMLISKEDIYHALENIWSDEENEINNNQ